LARVWAFLASCNRYGLRSRNSVFGSIKEKLRPVFRVGADIFLVSQLEVSVADFWGGNGLERCFASLTLLKSGNFTSLTTIIIAKSPFGTPVQNKQNPVITDVAYLICP